MVPLLREITDKSMIPRDLLLEADPNELLVNQYLSDGIAVGAFNLENELLGVYILAEIAQCVYEIKNISVKADFQGQGIGSTLLEDAKHRAEKLGANILHIATADLSRKQQNLYRRLGFQLTSVVEGFFIDHYPEPVLENGKLCKDKHIFSMQLSFCCSTREK